MNRDESSDASNSTSRLDERVVELLSSHSGRLAFNGLRRALGAHPESLVRALKRLEREGVVERVDRAYSLSDPPGAASAGIRTRLREIASVALPSHFDRPSLFGALAGRWFGRLRWVGIYEHPGDPWLVWSIDGTPGHVLLRARRGRLEVLVEMPPRAVASDQIESAARDLLTRGLEALRQSDGSIAPSDFEWRPDSENWGPDSVTEFRRDRSISSIAG
jgi:DNA-binding Lrp family transcriptional regulator